MNKVSAQKFGSLPSGNSQTRGVGTIDETRFVPEQPVGNPDAGASEVEALDGWGFADTRFVVRPDGSTILTGNRYNISNIPLPDLMPWFAGQLASPISYENRNEPHYPPKIPDARTNAPFLAVLRSFLQEGQWTDAPQERLRRGHGHTGGEIWAIRYGALERVPDLVVFPRSHEEVVKLVEAAAAHGVCLIPFGGGTNVTEALRIPLAEDRLVVAVDMRQMRRILWVDPTNRMACVEAGITGRHLAAELAKLGFTMGHEPDSIEFSTLGGWIATNASGMKKNRYGNIEELVLDMQVVTAQGVVERPQQAPRESVGVNPRQYMFGSEGNFGIITTAVIKLFPLPAVRRYGSVIFRNLSTGLDFLYELQRARAIPASVRVMDNKQFHFGQALKAAKHGFFAKLKSTLEKLLVTRVKGFDPYEMAVATIVFEGSEEEVAYQEKVVYRIAAALGGLAAGAANGERGYQLTFGIAYIRDLTFEHWAIAESFETSVPWSRAMELYERTRQRVEREHAAMNLPGKPFFSGRITQVYETGVVMYFYLGFYARGTPDPVAAYAALEHAAREEILASGGSLSHHHGIGKIRRGFLRDVYSEGAMRLNRQVKAAIDPHNVFGASNCGVNGPVALSERGGLY